MLPNSMTIHPMEKFEHSTKLILLDCDVISHFIANNVLDKLPEILMPHQCLVLDYVYSEVAARPMRLAYLEAMIKSGKIQKMSFPEDTAINQEFARIKKLYPLIGDGERACMAVARFFEDIIASSNFRDVAPYCKEHDIRYLGTLDILSVASEREIFNEQQCDQFIQTALTYNKARFPKGVTAIRFYTPGDTSFL